MNSKYPIGIPSKSFQGVNACIHANRTDIPICFPFLVTIDYLGFRLVASSILPINRSTLRYGSSGENLLGFCSTEPDGGKTAFNEDPVLADYIKQLAQSLNLKGHFICNRSQFVYLAGDVEG